MSMIDIVVKHHTSTGRFLLSSGKVTDTYIDFRAALLCRECTLPLMQYYAKRISEEIKLHRNRELGVVDAVVGTGVFGGMILSQLRWPKDRPVSIIWNKKVVDKKIVAGIYVHGVEWSGLPMMENDIRDVLLIDDIRTTGETLRRMHEACVGKGWNVVGEIVYDPSSSR